MLYIIIGVSALGIFIFHFLPEEKALNWLVTYRGYYSKREEYDWVKTLRKHTIFLLSCKVKCTTLNMIDYYL